MRQRATLAALVVALLSAPGYALAYCRTTTCDQQNPPASCPTVAPGVCNTSGIAIAWPNTCVSTSVSAQGSALRNITADQMRSIVENAFQQWTSVDCGNGTKPNFIVDMFPDVNCTDVTGNAGYKTTGPNYNIWIFHDSDWPSATGGSTATATPTFTQIYSSIISVRCTSCHGTGAAGSLNMSNQATAYANLVGSNGTGVMAAGPSCGTSGLLRVDPGNASMSLLWEKVNSKLQGTSAPCGNPMPASGAALTQAQVDEIAAWINAGAMNN